MNRSKTDCSTTTEIQRRVKQVCQESKRTTTTTEHESDESLVSTIICYECRLGATSTPCRQLWWLVLRVSMWSRAVLNVVLESIAI